MDTVFYYFYMLCETFKDYVAKSLICRDGGIQSKYSKNGRPIGEKKGTVSHKRIWIWKKLKKKNFFLIFE